MNTTENQAGQGAEDRTKVSQEANKPIANPADDGTRHVDEPANDWPAADAAGQPTDQLSPK